LESGHKDKKNEVSSLPPPEWIETSEELDAWIDYCSSQTILAVDTESDSFHHYTQKVCLIQMTAGKRDVLIDPLVLGKINLKRLGPLFKDDEKVKIFHDAGYDLLCLKRDFAFNFRNIFDTMLASRILGVKQFGLAHVLNTHFGVQPDKRYQRSDWSKRPLSAEQVSYARLDTHYLPRLVDILQEQLELVERWDWALEEFERLPKVVIKNTSATPENALQAFWRLKGIRRMTPIERGRCKELYVMRDNIAQKFDRPAFKVFPDALLVDLAQNPPADFVSVQPRRGLRRAGIEMFGKKIISALEQAEPIRSADIPKDAGKSRRRRRFLDPKARHLYEDLRQLRSNKAEVLGIEPEVALSNAVLEELALSVPKRLSESTSWPILKGWRKDIFAKDISVLLSSKA